MKQTITFGTDGWRGIIGRDFTFENVRYVALAAARLAKKLVKGTDESPSIVLGYDARFLSAEFAREVAQVLAAQKVRVLLTDGIATTPQVSFATKKRKATFGIIITASHNPAEYNGFKLKGTFGGPSYPEQVKDLEAILAKILDKQPTVKLAEYDKAVKDKLIKEFDARTSYFSHCAKKLDLNAIRESGLRVLYDPMHGAGINTIKNFLPEADEIHGDWNPGFGNLDHPEPMGEYLGDLKQSVYEGGYDIGIATDGDADRVGLVDAQGNFVDSHRIFMLLLKYLVEDKKKKGSVAKTVSLTTMVEKYCEAKGIKLFQTPVGFKYIAKLMVEEKLLLGGEESGGLGTNLHIPERDGLFNALLVMEMMVKRGKSLSELCHELDEEFGVHRYRRRDVKVTEKIKQRVLKACKSAPKTIAGYTVVKHDNTDGYKFFFEHGWLLIRASGTEPLLRYYAESDSLERVNELLDAGLAL